MVASFTRKTGNVWSNPWDFNVSDLRYDVGPGLRYQTPVGPIRADLGYQINPLPGLLVKGEPQTRRSDRPLRTKPHAPRPCGALRARSSCWSR